MKIKMLRLDGTTILDGNINKFELRRNTCDGWVRVNGEIIPLKEIATIKIDDNTLDISLKEEE